MGGGNSKSKKEFKILMLGLDNAGKTSILYRLKLGQIVQTSATIGFNSETILYKGKGFVVWDVGGQESLRQMWKHYFAETDAIIFVIDSTDPERIELATTELHKVLEVLKVLHYTPFQTNRKDTPLLIFANKQDLPNSLSVSAIIEKMKLNDIITQKWVVQASSSLLGQGLLEGIDWISGAICK